MDEQILGIDASDPSCLYCGNVIGVRDPVVIVEHEGERATSLAREPELRDKEGVIFVHRRCAPQGWAEGS